MDRDLAAKHGTAFVYLAAFAIDIDRVRELTEDDDGWPFGWEVFLLARYLDQELDSSDHEELIEEACALAFELGDVLGAQLPFSVYELVSRGCWPESLADVYASWKKPPRELSARLTPLWEDPNATARLATACIASSLQPALAPPTREALEHLAATGTV